MNTMQPLNTRLDYRVQERIEQATVDAISGINTGDSDTVTTQTVDFDSEEGVSVTGAPRLSELELRVIPQGELLTAQVHLTDPESVIEDNHVRPTYADATERYVFYLDEFGGGYTRFARALVTILSAYLNLPPAEDPTYEDMVYGSRLMPAVSASDPTGSLSRAVIVDSSLQQVYQAPWSHQSREQDLPIQRVPITLPDLSVE